MLQPFRRKYNLIKSNQSIYDFKKYDPNVTNDKIDWDKYKIGDCVIYRGWTNRAYRGKPAYIRSYCSRCTESINDKLNEDYFKYPDSYLCKSCKHNNWPFINNGGYKICKNCFERFKYKNYDEKLCSDCKSVNILDYYKYLLKYEKLLECSDCKDNLPKLCDFHHNKKILYKYDELFKSCKFCIKQTPQNCKMHKYYFINK